MKYLLLLLLLNGPSVLPAIDHYEPGDTLYVWATSGLVLRKAPSLGAAKLSSIPYGTALVALNYNQDKSFEVEAVPGFVSQGKQYPPVMLRGDFAWVVFQGDTGFVFNGYLSKMPALHFSASKNDRPPVFENFGVWAQRNFGLVAEIRRGTGEYGLPSSAKTVFGNGFVLDGWSEKDSEGRAILPDISMEEAFLIFNYLEHYEWDVRHVPQETAEYPWVFNRTGDREWRFSGGACEHKILYLPEEKMVVTTSHCIE
ncbi:MAG: SH3 domain-containing protein [Lewinellaceae bacterium]|nr:SH3 domain-containing protein [Lewinellaceae bacterium]